MKRLFLLILFIFLANICFASNIIQPPVDRELSLQTRQYLKNITDNLNVLSITTTAPNGNRVGIKGEIIFYNNSGTFELWGNTDGNKVWQQI